MSTRLTALVVVASVTGLVFGGLRVADSVGNAGVDARTAQLARLGQQATILAQAMENERDLSAGVAAYGVLAADASADHAGGAVVRAIGSALATEKKKLAAAEELTDTEAGPTASLAAAIGPTFPPTAQSEALTVGSMISSIPATRGQVEGQPAAAVISNYSASIADLFALDDEITASSGDAQLAESARGLGALSRAKDEASQQRAFIYSALIETSVNDAGGTGHKAPFNGIAQQSISDAGSVSVLDTAMGMQAVDLGDFNDAATPDESNAYQDALASQQNASVQLIEGSVSLYGDPRLTFEPIGDQTSLGYSQSTVADDWYANMTWVIGQMRQIETQVVSAMVARSQTLQQGATNSAVLTAALTTLGLLLVLLATVLVRRTLVNPLRRLQSDALDIAMVRLPARVAAAASDPEENAADSGVEPIGVRSTDEIGKVARAFDQVHAEAVRLAGNEAQLRSSLNAMFISLSRRSVPLIDRLSRMIDAMEQTEDDPDRLANLFSMDHLVTRMRRNSENLLVLAGEEPVRKWTESVPLADVTRAAAAEIEQYGRVTLTGQAGVTVSGQAAADVVHLLAELIENATLFSPQTSQVRVSVMELSTGGVLVDVRDEGVGVSANRLADMNWRLDNPPALDVSISRHMGLYAVAHLAARHGIRVKLRPGTPQGLSALVWLPGSLARQERAAAGPSGHSQRLSGGTASTGVMGTASRGAVGAAPTGARVTESVGAGGARPLTAGRPGPLAGQGSGRHRGASVSGGQPLLAGRGSQGASQATVWFAAKRPSSGPARSADELAASWRPTTAGRVPGSGLGSGGYGFGRETPGGQAPAGAEAGQTSAGLPRRTPRTTAQPGSGTPDWGMPAQSGSGPRTEGAALLGAPEGGPTTPLPTPFAGPPPTPYTTPPPTQYQGASAFGAPYQGASRGEQLPSRRRSPEAVRNRLSGFQLGSRDAVPPGQEPRQAPPAGEENSR